jgi:tRNA dimethylallyltransferase
MTVYRGMDIGTAKPTPAERAEVPYHGLDLADPNEIFTVARWLAVAEPLVERPPGPLVLAGGTPLYFQALFHGLFAGPPADPGLRQELAQVPTEELHHRLAAVDVAAAARIHVNDRKRLTRALEVFEATGQPISQQQTQWAADEPRFASVRFGLSWSREDLNRRINARTRQMLANGWLDEVRGLLDLHGGFSPTAAEAAGYSLLAEVVRGRMPLEEAAEQIKIRTRQLAKRQMSWFRRFSDVTWLPGDAPLEQNVAAVLAAWSSRRSTPGR